MAEVARAAVLAHLDKQGGDPDTGFISSADVKSALGELWDNAHEARTLPATPDLTLYYTKAEADTILTTRYTKTETDATFATIASVYTKGQVDTSLALYYTKVQADAKYALIGAAYTKAESDTAMALKVDSTVLAGYYTVGQVNTALGLKVDTTTLASYSTTTAMNTALALKANVTALASYYTSAQTDTALALKANLSALASYYTKSEIDTTLAGIYTKTQADAAFGLIYGRRAPGVTAPRRLPLTHFATGHGFSFVNHDTTNSNLNDTTGPTPGPMFGTQCIKMVTLGTGAQTTLRNLSFPSTNYVGKSQITWIYCPDVTKLSSISITIGTSSFANRRTETLVDNNSQGTNAKVLESNKWLPLESFVGGGFLTGTDMNTAATNLEIIAVDTNTGSPATIYIGGIDTVTNDARYPAGVIVPCFDDSYVSHWTLARPKMAQYGYQGVLFPINAYVGSGGSYVTLAQLRTMQDLDGWDVSPHCSSISTHNHIMSQPDPAAELVLTKSWLQSNGFTAIDTYAYPLGTFNGAEDLVAKYFTVGRSIARTWNQWPFLRPTALRAVSGIGGVGGYGVSSVTGTIDKIALYGGVYILTFHNIVAGSATVINECSVTDFNTIIDYIATKGVPVRTFSQLAQGM